MMKKEAERIREVEKEWEKLLGGKCKVKITIRKKEK